MTTSLILSSYLFFEFNILHLKLLGNQWKNSYIKNFIKLRKEQNKIGQFLNLSL